MERIDGGYVYVDTLDDVLTEAQWSDLVSNRWRGPSAVMAYIRNGEADQMDRLANMLAEVETFLLESVVR